MKSFDGELFRQMILSASNNLYNHYPEVDALNVFPVPDGDTGMNMNLTMSSGAKEVENRNDKDISVIAKAFSRGLLMGARGNSGVITSQIFRGFVEGLAGKSSINAIGLADALVEGSKVAYKAVVRPVEGTILTVIRETSEALRKNVNESTSIEKAFAIILKEANASLKRTPNLLPILKEVGVVDSGGAGLVKIFEGMKAVVDNSFIERNEVTAVDDNINDDFDENSEYKGYFIEFVLSIDPKYNKKAFNLNRFSSVLSSHSSDVEINEKSEEKLVIVSLNALKPGDIFNYAQQYGEFIKIKCENIGENQKEVTFNSEIKNEELDYCLIATSSGEGIDNLFKEVGVNYIVSGGQTMNPSTNDFDEIIKNVNAKVYYIFPNNGNIILAASQVKDIEKDKKIYVIPTKTIMQGVVSAMNFNPDLSDDDNEKAMIDAIGTIKSGCVTYAIKNSEINGIHVNKGEYMAIKESKDILSSFKSKFDALKHLIDSLIDEESSIITCLYGSDIQEDEANAYKEILENKYSNLEIDFRAGNQPVYSFIVGVE